MRASFLFEWSIASCVTAMLFTSAEASAAAPTVRVGPPQLFTPDAVLRPMPTGDVRTASGGGVTLVVYADDDASLGARRFGGDGAPLGEPFDVATNGHGRWAVAFDGSAFVVAWVNYLDPRGYFLLLQRISVTGELLGAPLEVEQLEVSSNAFALAGSSAGALLVSCNVRADLTPPGACRTWRVTTSAASAGTLVLDATIPAGGLKSVASVAVVSSASGWLVALHKSDGPLGVVRVNTTGAFVDATPLAVSSPSAVVEAPALMGTPDGFLLAWSEAAGTRLASVSPSRQVSVAPLIAETARRRPALAMTSSGPLLIRTTDPVACAGCGAQVSVQRLSTSLALSGTPHVFPGERHHNRPRRWRHRAPVCSWSGPIGWDSARRSSSRPNRASSMERGTGLRFACHGKESRSSRPVPAAGSVSSRKMGSFAPGGSMPAARS